VCGIAGIGIDHRQWLGTNSGDIAAEKAGIAKAGVPLVTQRYPPLVAQRVHQAAESAGARWIARGALWDSRLIRGNIRYRDRSGAMKLPMPQASGAVPVRQCRARRCNAPPAGPVRNSG
jgi:dihydrofolate synthase / folylpolyglutamate synthase